MEGTVIIRCWRVTPARCTSSCSLPANNSGVRVGLTGRYDGGFRFILYTWMSSWR